MNLRESESRSVGSSPLLVSLASLIGLVFEFYDFLIFGFLASVLSKLFFPTNNPISSLLLTFTAFATGYLLRPVGAIVFGHIGDRIGRRYTLVFTISIMASASLFSGLLPPYASIGVLAPVLLTAFRMMQGFSLGGEMGGAYTLTAEASPRSRRGIFMSVTSLSVPIAIILTSSILGGVESLFPGQSFLSLGWRVLFFIGALIGVIGMLIRLTISESLIFKKTVDEKRTVRIPLSEAIRGYWRRILIVLGLISGGTVITYASSVFALSYLVSIVKVPAGEATVSVTVGYLAYLFLTVPFGVLSDIAGRKVNLLAGVVGLILFIYPYFYMLSTGSFFYIIAAQSVLGIFQALFTTGWTPIQTELFPTKVRYTALSFGAQISLAFFGGFTPLISTYLIEVTGFKLAPIYWAYIMLIVSFISVLLVKETKGIDMDF
jgi:MHS family proline/betaine transporter-like MFS transporter